MLSKRTLDGMLFFLLISIMWSPYISSWFPKVNSLPLGPIVRDVAILFFYSLFLLSFLKVRHVIIFRIHLYIVLIFLSYILISIILNDSTSLQIILGLHAFLFYPMVFSFLYFYYLNNKNIGCWYTSIKYLKSLLTCLLIIASTIAIIDVITNGYFTLMLGYDPNYGGDGFMLITRYYDLVRANGGFADALAFGYLMVVGFIFFLYKINTSSNGAKYIDILGLGLTSLAATLSITRGAIIALLLVFIIFLYKSKVLVWIPVLLLSGIIAISISLSSYSDIFIGRFTDSDKGSKASTNLRYEMAMDSIDYLSKNPMG
ncbi:Lipid A core - O-antigen ligase and related enzymes [Pragia fontium]|uniref:O-antigen ligase family protein n=1 Tax=Pragia fontium TaxID=82985 RepID=UPI000DFBDE28|nr:O-antigen ligase family protein [Pragia fontium]SUB83278.1 Lipid A core - O-antigen ligase and related enzymes [Pragia fontium]